VDNSVNELTQEQIVKMLQPIPGDFVVYLLTDRKMKVLYFSDSILSSFGVTAEEFRCATEDDALDVVMSADRDKVLSTVFGKPAGPELIQCQFRLMHREKGFFWVHSKSRIIGTMNGCPVILTNYLNASAEAESYSRILEDTSTAFCTVDVNTKEILYANLAARNLSKAENRNIYAGYLCREYFFTGKDQCEECPMEKLAVGQQESIERFDETAGRWFSVDFKRVIWLGHDCLEISANDITEIKTKEKILKQETAKFYQSVDQMLAMNPNALCTFQINLTRNRCSEGHGTSEYIRRLLQSDTADGLLNNISSIIPDSGQRDKVMELFDRKKLLSAFQRGRTSLSVDYMRSGENGRPFWVRTYINMLKNPGTQDVIGVFYSQDISAEKRQNEIFNIITGEEYDYVALLHADISKIEFLNVGRKLLKKYHEAFDRPGVLFDFDEVRQFAADSWVDQLDRDYYLRSSSVDAVRQELDRNGHCELSIRGHYTGHPDELMCRKIQHYYLDEEKHTILIIQADVTETYKQQMKETELEKSEKERLSDILDGLPAGICVLNMPDPEHVRTSFCNRQMYRLLDIAPDAGIFEKKDQSGDQPAVYYFQDEFMGVHPDDRQRMREVFRKGYDQDRFSVSDVRFMGGSGKYKHITMELVLRDAGPEEHIFYAFYRDVSEEAALQRKLDEQHRMQMERTLVDTIGRLPANYVLYSEDQSGMLVPERYSDEFCRMKGCSQENIREFNGMDGFAPVHPDDRTVLEKTVRACREDNQLYKAEYRIRTRNKGYQWVSVNYSFFTVGEKRYLYAVFTDIDDLKKQERQLEEQYNTALAFLNSVAGTYLATLRVNLIKNTVESIDGRDPLNMKDRTADYDIFVRNLIENLPRIQDRRNCAKVLSRESLIRAFRRGEKNRSVEYMLRLPDGKLNWVRKNITLAKRPESDDIIAFAAVSDINEEKLTGEIMEQVVSRQFDYIACISVETGRLVLFFSNSGRPELSRIKPGMKYDDVFRSYNARYVSPGEVEKSIAFMSLDHVRKALENTDRIAEVFTGDDGAGQFAAQVEFFWLDRENGLIVLVRTDITEAQRHQLEHEQKLRLALAAAETANRAKSDFLSRMSHDIRTPLNGIIGMTYLTKTEKDPDRIKGNLDKIDMSSKFLLGLINDILDMSKAESGKIELHPEPYPAQEFASYMEAVIRPLVTEKNQTIDYQIDLPQGIVPLQDKLRMNQIVFNILSNAVKFTPEGGKIRYTASGKKMPDGHMRMHIEVSDNGIGMSEEFQKTIFDPFSQEGRNDSSSQRGTGLGMAITKRLVDLMGGTIRVESRIGQGTTFFVDLILETVQAAAAEKAASADGETEMQDNSALAGKHILLCEDHPLNQEIARALLEEKGMIVTTADDGKTGTEMFRDSSPGFYDAILMDIRMPVMDGYEAAEKIRTMDRTDAQTVPIIAMTADAFSEDIQKCFDAGMNGHIAKPVDPVQLYRTIQSVFSKREGES